MGEKIQEDGLTSGAARGDKVGDRMIVDGQIYSSAKEAGIEIVAGTLLDHSVQVSFEGSEKIYEVACNACKLHIDNSYGMRSTHIRRIIDACLLGVYQWCDKVDMPCAPASPGDDE